ncbi:hypothetical protein FCH28_24380 [Streptomyces piniterrae]|uniref:Uncharacterized protein n=1 Tax=Streptomyces piniterrae TaxID=2571125 RepID=A0A4U0N779_9ACTN|nr:hypothetical protein [Streptomyces piniterrae]TJZ49456.1 hypothetical protein FCH28_24380 [Streptomyces piniterrae]
MTRTLRGVLLAAGAIGGYLSFRLADEARRYCGSYGLDEGSLELGRPFEPFIAVAVGVTLAALVRAPVRGPAWWQATVPVVLLLVFLFLVAWAHMAWLGTPFGGTSDSGHCGYDNVPPWWPLPA